MGGGTEIIEYQRVQNRPHTIVLKDLNETLTSPLRVNRIEVKENGESKGWIEWCAATGIIMADSGGQYMIGNDKTDSFFPNFKPGQGNAKFSAIKYLGSNAKYPQIYMFDYDNYYEIIGNPHTGEIFRNLIIGACGPLKMNTRKVEKLTGSYRQGEWSLVKTNTFDSDGRLIRVVDAENNVTGYSYDKAIGKLTLLTENGQIKQSNKFSSTGMPLEKIRMDNGIEYKSIYGSSGEFVEQYTDGKLEKRMEFENGQVVKTILYDKFGNARAFTSLEDLLSNN